MQDRKMSNFKNNSTGRKAVGAQRLFSRVCRFSTTAIWPVVFLSCTLHRSHFEALLICCTCKS